MTALLDMHAFLILLFFSEDSATSVPYRKKNTITIGGGAAVDTILARVRFI